MADYFATLEAELLVKPYRKAGRLEEFFTQVQGPCDTSTTRSHFSLAQLALIEPVVLTVMERDGT
jgi:hypothetical protein